MRVVNSVETNQISSQNSVENITAPWQRAENFRTGKWNMQKPADGCLRKTLAQHLRKKHQMIILNPDGVALMNERSNLVCELLVHGRIDFECLFVKICLMSEIVKQRPQSIIGETRVVTLDL